MRGYRLFVMAILGLAPLGLGVASRAKPIHENNRPATCAAIRFDGDGGHVAPAPDCSCGYYAWFDRQQVSSAGQGGFATVVAEVEAEGVCQIHARGLRAQYLRITAIEWPPCSNCGKRATWLVAPQPPGRSQGDDGSRPSLWTMQEYSGRGNLIGGGFDRSETKRSLAWHRLGQPREEFKMSPLFTRLWRLAHRDPGWIAILCGGCADNQGSTFATQPLIDYLRFLAAKYDCIVKESADGHR